MKHEYEKPFQTEKPRFVTCNADTKQVVTGLQTLQEVKDNEEIFFTYDVKFQV